MSGQINEGGPEAIIRTYIEASGARDVEQLKSIVHDDCTMTGFLMGNFINGSMEPYYAALSDPSKIIDETYFAEISSVQQAGSIASVVLVEKNLMGLHFEDYFHLVKVNGSWKIISKTFSSFLPS